MLITFEAFIDPFFSSGVHLALTSALSAAATICATIRGDVSESEAAKWHSGRVATSFTRFVGEHSLCAVVIQQLPLDGTRARDDGTEDFSLSF
jgi:hypothetical protein